MSTKPQFPSDEWFREKQAAGSRFFDAGLAVVDKVEKGEITEEEATDQIAALLEGSRRRERAQNFLLHTLHQAELDEHQRRTGERID